MGREKIKTLTGSISGAKALAFSWHVESLRRERQLSQAQAAEAVGVSRRQWIRYAQGGPIPLKRLPKMAEAFDVTLDALLALAGFEVPGLGAGVDLYLRRIRERVFEGSWSGALFSLYQLFYRVHPEKKRHKKRSRRSTVVNFVVAAVAINQMPGWLKRELVEYILAVELGGRKQDFPPPPAIRKQVRDRIKKMLTESTLDESEYPLFRVSEQWDFEDVMILSGEFG